MPGTNIFDLAAKITADTKDAEKNLTDTQKKVIDLANKFKTLDSSTASSSKSLSGAGSILKNLSSTAVSLQGPLGGVAGRLQGLSSLVTQFGSASAGAAGPIGLIVAGIVAIGAAAVTAGKQLVDLTISTAEWEGHLYDLSQQLGISASTLGAFEVVAQTTGGNIDTLSASLSIFQSKMEEAEDPTSKTAKEFAKLGITSKDTTEALKQAAQGLFALGTGYKQSAEARDLFGRGGKAFLAIVQETGGDLDSLIDRLKRLGIVLGDEDYAAADKFNDQLAILGDQLRGLGAEFVKEIGLMQAMADVLDYLTSRRWTITWQVINIGGALIPIPSGVMGTENPFAGVTGGLGRTRAGGGGGGGGGGRGGSAKAAVDDYALALDKFNKQIDEAIKGSDQWQKEIDKLVETLAKKKKALNDVQMAELLGKAEELRHIEAEKTAREFMQQLKNQLDEAGHSGDEWDKQLAEINKTLARYQLTLKDVVGQEAQDLIMRLRLIDASKKEAEAIQQLNIVRQRYAEILRNTRPRRAGVPENEQGITIQDLGGGSVYGRVTTTPTIEDMIRGGRPRRAEPDYYGILREQTKRFAEELTNLISDSLHTGFERGMKAGLVEFAQGILRMIESKVLNKLADAITDALMKGISGAQRGGGGSIWGGILNVLLGGLLGGLGGGVTSKGGPLAGVTGGISGSHQTGLAYVPRDNYLALLHRGERVLTASENRNGTRPVIFNMTVYAKDARSFQSRDTRRQISDAYRKELQTSALR